MDLIYTYINDLSEAVECECKMYANDIKINFSNIRNSKGHWCSSRWIKDWHIILNACLNASECKVMHVGRNNSKIVYEIEDVSTDERKSIEKCVWKGPKNSNYVRFVRGVR